MIKLEEAIQQGRGFQSEWHRCLVNIIFTYNFVKQNLSEFLEQYGLTMQQYNVLRIVNGQFPGGISSSGIQERMLDKHSDVSRIIKRLEKAEFIAKSKNPNNKRALHIEITAKGRLLVQEIMANEYHSLLLKPFLSEQDAAQLNDLLDAVRG
jgi:DNA-binding MarR family transcriptional regulator